VSGSLSSLLPLKLHVPQGSVLGPIIFTTYVNDLPLSLSESEVDIDADDTAISSSGYNCEEIQRKLRVGLDNASHCMVQLPHQKIKF
jgi:hypothetical protein